MGLDMWLRAKTSKKKELGQAPTGVCSGLFGIIPDDEGMIEVGYWRKAYDQNDMFMNNIASFRERPKEEGDGCCINYRVNAAEVDTILKEAEQVLKTHEFDENGDDITPTDEIICYTWDCKNKWEMTVEIFKRAKEILETDPDAEIYYCYWY